MRMRTLIHADVISDGQRGLVIQFVPSEFRRFGLELTSMLVDLGTEGPNEAVAPLRLPPFGTGPSGRRKLRA